MKLNQFLNLVRWSAPQDAPSSSEGDAEPGCASSGGAPADFTDTQPAVRDSDYESLDGPAH